MIAIEHEPTVEMILTDLRKNLFEEDKTIAGIRGLYREEKTRIAIRFADLCNNYYSDYPEITDAILANPKIFQNFTIFASACAIQVGYTWECEERNSCSPHWDNRRRASEQFCHEHLDVFLTIFRDTAGFAFPFREKREYRSCVRDMDYHGTLLTPLTALWGELVDFTTEEPRLKQKAMGLFCRILGKGGIYPEILSDVRFPDVPSPFI